MKLYISEICLLQRKSLLMRLGSQKLKRTINWKPKVSFEEGIEKTIEWYIQNPEFFKNISKKLFTKRLGLL